MPFDGGFQRVGLDVAEDGEHAIVRREEAGMKGGEIGGLDLLHAGFGALVVQAVAAVAEEAAAHEAEGGGQ